MMFYQDLQKGSFYSLRAHGKGGASATILFLSAPPPEKSAGGSQQAGKKEGGWGEGIFARLLTAPKARLGWERLRSVQKRFALRSVIATNQNLTIFQDEMIARSPRLRRVSLRKNPFAWRLNQTAGEARRGLVWKAGGGSELRSNSQMKFVSNFFLCRFAALRSQFFNPALYSQRRLII